MRVRGSLQRYSTVTPRFDGRISARLEPIYDTVRRAQEPLWLPPGQDTHRFCREPRGRSRPDVAGKEAATSLQARRLAERRQSGQASREIIARIEAITLDYLLGPVEAGAEASAIGFDSWAGSLSPAQFEQGAICSDWQPARLAAPKGAASRPFRSLAFPRSQAECSRLMCASRRSAHCGLDASVDPGVGRAGSCPRQLPVQGNLDRLR